MAEDQRTETDRKGDLVIIDFTNDDGGSGVNLKRKAELDARMKQRELDVKKKNDEGGIDKNKTDPQQIAKNFDAQFGAMKKDMAERLEQARSGKVVADELTTQFDYMIDLIQKMKSLLALSASTLNAYDLQQSQKYIDSLEQEVPKTKEDLLPKKKFAFSKNKKKITTATAGEETTKTSNMNTSNIVQDITDQKDDFTFTDIKDRTIYIVSMPNAVRINKATNCQFYFGPVTGSVFIDNCDHCIFHIASRQIRIHTTRNCDFYLNVQSRPTIEDCTDIRFAPYAFDYANRESDFQSAGFNDKDNQWIDVQDFNWLKPNSPNWRVLPEADRVKVVSADLPETK